MEIVSSESPVLAESRSSAGSFSELEDIQRLTLELKKKDKLIADISKKLKESKEHIERELESGVGLYASDSTPQSISLSIPTSNTAKQLLTHKFKAVLNNFDERSYHYRLHANKRYIYIAQDFTRNLIEYDAFTNDCNLICLDRFIDTLFNYTSTTLLPNGDVFICGGLNSDGENLCHDAYILDISTLQCRKLPRMIYPRNKHALIYYQDYIYAFGGEFNYTSERFDLRNNRWEVLPDMSRERYDFSCVAFEESIYLLGSKFDETIECLDLRTLSYSVLDTGIYQWGNISCIVYDRVYILDRYNLSVLNTDMESVEHIIQCWDKPRYSYSNTVRQSDTLYYFNYHSSYIESFNISTYEVKELLEI